MEVITFNFPTASLSRPFLKHLLDKVGRTKRQGRVVGGTTARDGEFPWMVCSHFPNLHLPDDFSLYLWLGIITKKRFLWTSSFLRRICSRCDHCAHCCSLHRGVRKKSIWNIQTFLFIINIYSRLKPIGVWVVGGEYQLDVVSGFEQEFKANQLILHENYDSSLLKNDIGLIRINNSFLFNDKLKAAKLPAVGYFTRPETPTTVAGWGSTKVIYDLFAVQFNLQWYIQSSKIIGRWHAI